MSSTHKKTRIVGPPSSSSAKMANSSVRLVLRDLPRLSDILKLATDSRDLFGYSRTFSRNRSKITIVSFTLYPMTVRRALRNIVLTSISKSLSASIQNNAVGD